MNCKLLLLQDGTASHFYRAVHAHLNKHLPNGWIGWAVQEGFLLLKWPSRSPDLTPRDSLLWGHVKDVVYMTSCQQTSTNWNYVFRRQLPLLQRT